MVEPDESRFTNAKFISRYPGLERLICAALADTYFATALIKDPERALNRVAPDIHLSPTEYHLALTVTNAKDIHDYAARLYTMLKT
ncbi:MAG: hypothetical protein GFH27_549293n96 [Chloroflexi bacterium AL-W]|nr:hypothetical protein [Chloroflexi bacterium AL-N1]NOK67789.1 hypothetical protein [Chloroflexi bacterium AL-N10]NOK75441.1 hypothetical protein [Chloroflexi bacterium AL-N5]NOK82229.1 hypothetical protein [Chloroflexi bacterium AL-W]NOK90074.1 hypothetical protein [Chloroflexi bacterium AL-N15]